MKGTLAMAHKEHAASVARLEQEITKGRLRLSQRLDKLGLGDDAPVASTDETAKGRLYRVFSLVAEY